MTPGLANEPPFPQRAVKGAVIAVAGLDRHTVPLFVGICEIDISALGEVQGSKGHAVRGLHWEGDELWAWSSSSRPGQPSPDYIEGWDEDLESEEEGAEEIEEGLDDLALAEKDAGPTEEQEEPLGETPEDQPEETEEAAPVEKEPSTKGVSSS